MRKRNQSSEEIERKTRIRELLEISSIASIEDIQNLFQETITEFMENGLDAELDEALGCSKYDYRSDRVKWTEKIRACRIKKIRRGPDDYNVQTNTAHIHKRFKKQMYNSMKMQNPEQQLQTDITSLYPL